MAVTVAPTDVDDLIAGLLEKGPMKVNDLLQELEAQNVTEAQLRRARKRLGYKSVRTGFGSGATYWLCRPGQEEQARMAGNPRYMRSAAATREAKTEARVEREATLATLAEGMEHPDDLSILTPPMVAFLTEFSKTGIVKAACEKADISRRTVYVWRHNVAAFEEAFALALADAADLVELQAVKGAMGAWTREVPTPHGVETVRMAPDARMVAMLLRARKPAEFDRRTDGASQDPYEDDGLTRITSALFGGSSELHDVMDELEEAVALQSAGELDDERAQHLAQRLTDVLDDVVDAEIVA